MSHSFYTASRATHRKVMIIGLTLCAVFVLVSYFLKQQPDNAYVLLKADKLIRTAGRQAPANWPHRTQIPRNTMQAPPAARIFAHRAVASGRVSAPMLTL